MKKSELKTGMVVETSIGNKFLVMLNPDCPGRELIDFNYGYMSLKDYSDDLRYTAYGGLAPEWNIAKVYRIGSCICYILQDKDAALSNAILIWEREVESVEMTVSEIEKKLGITNLKIVKGDKE